MLTLCQVQGQEIHRFDSIWFCVLSTIIPFYWRQNWDSERLTNLPKIPQLISASSKIQMEVVWFKVCALSHHHPTLPLRLHTLMCFRCEMINLGAVSGGRGVEKKCISENPHPHEWQPSKSSLWMTKHFFLQGCWCSGTTSDSQASYKPEKKRSHCALPTLY